MSFLATGDLYRMNSSRPFFLAIFVGAIADNYSWRAVMIVGRSLMMAASAMLTILMAFVSAYSARILRAVACNSLKASKR